MTEYLTIKQYAEKYNVPRTTVQYWVKRGILESDNAKRPFKIPDDQPYPFKDKLLPSFRYSWRDDEKGITY